VSRNSDGVTTVRMDSSFPEVLELEEQISFTVARAVSRVELGSVIPGLENGLEQWNALWDF